MTTDEVAAILAQCASGLPLVVYVDGVLREVEAVYGLQHATYLPADGIVARGPVIVLTS